MAAIIPAALVAAAAAAEVKAILRQVGDVLTDGEGQYIKSGNPTGVIPAVGLAGARHACRRWASDPDGSTAATNLRMERSCRPYLDDIGAGAALKVSQPFNGGQCPGVRYAITFQYNSILANGETIEPPTVVVGNPAGPGFAGPIRGVVGRGSPQFQSIVLLYGENQEAVLRSGNCPQGCYRNIKLVSVQRVDGLADECGDPPPDITQPTPDPSPVARKVPFIDAAGNTVNITADILPDGTIAVDFGTGTINIGDISASVGEGSGGGEGESASGIPGTAGSAVETGAGDAVSGSGGEAEGEAPEGAVLTGVRVDILSSPPSRTRYTPEVDRGVVYVYMGTPDGMGLDPTGSLVRSGQFFFAQKEYLTKWRVSSRFGYNTLVTPYYR